MAGYDLVIRANDTLPALTQTLIDPSTGVAANLTGSSVQFVMRSQTAAAAAVNAAATVTDAAAGQVTYSWQPGDTSVAGLFSAVFRVTTTSGGTWTWPADGTLSIWVEADLTSDTSQQLVSVEDAKDHLNIPAADRTRDQKLARWIMAATPVVEQITGPIVVRSYDEWYDGGSMAIRLRHRPLVTLEACSIYLGPVEYPMSIVTQPQDGSVFSVMADPARGRVVRRGPGGSQIRFPGGAQSIHVIYTAGFAAVPENVRIGTLEMLRENWVDTQSPGWGRGVGSDRDTEMLSGPAGGYLVSDLVREWLQPNRRGPTVV